MAAYAPPAPQVMTTNLETMPGVVVRQVTQMAEAIAQAVGLPFEAKNEYAVYALPPGKKAAMDHSDAAMWRPTAQEITSLPEFLHVQEDSSLCSRIGMVLLGCQNLRPLSLHFMTPSGHEEYRAQRPCKLGGCWCCPLEMTMSRGSVPIGKAMEDFSPYCGKCTEATYCCRFYHMALAPVAGRAVPETGSEGLERRYTIRYNQCCCGRVNNCCAVSCCAHNAIMDILDPKGQIVGNVQVTYAPDPAKACAACCRAGHLYNNFILDFPQGATQEDRALLLAALMNIEYHLFEKTGDDDN